jgi:hypothetical protein
VVEDPFPQVTKAFWHVRIERSVPRQARYTFYPQRPHGQVFRYRHRRLRGQGIRGSIARHAANAVGECDERISGWRSHFNAKTRRASLRTGF